MEQRTCSRCKETKSITEMVKDKTRRGEIRNICKPCRRMMSRKMREKYAEVAGRNIRVYEAKPLSNLSDEELLGYLVKFKEEYGRPPTSVDLDGLEGYPHVRTFYRRFKDCSKSTRERNWNDILALANITPLEIEKVWIAWEYLVSLACEKLYPDCLFQACNVVNQSRPDIVIESEKLIIDAVTSNYKARHKMNQFKKAINAGYRVEHWCLYKTTEKGIEAEQLKYVFLDEIVEKLNQINEYELAKKMKKLIEQYETHSEKVIAYKKQYIAKKLREVYRFINKTPTTEELALVKGCPSIAQIKKVFKHYNDALEYAGVPITRKKIPSYDEKIAVQELINLTEKLGKVPTYTELKKVNLTYTSKVYVKYFGGIRQCLQQQGIDVELLLKQEKEQVLQKYLDTIKAFYFENNKMPNSREYRDNKNLPSHNWILKYCGSMAELEKIIKKACAVK